MIRQLAGLTLALGLGFFAVTLPVSAADDAKPADWSAWSPVGVWSGEVSKLSRRKGEGFSLRVTTSVPVSPSRTRPGTMRTETKTYDLLFAEGALVRWAKLPPKLNDKGKKVERTAAELEELRKPTGAKGYKADRGDLKPGTLVEVTLVRPKELAAKDVQFSDYRIKSVTITGENPNAPDPKEKPKDQAKK